MTKTTTVPHLLEQLSVELHANGVKFDTTMSFGVRVNLSVRFEPVSERHDQPHFVIESMTLRDNELKFGASALCLEMRSGINVLDLIPKSQVAAIEENLLAQMSA